MPQPSTHLTLKSNVAFSFNSQTRQFKCLGQTIENVVFHEIQRHRENAINNHNKKLKTIIQNKAQSNSKKNQASKVSSDKKTIKNKNKNTNRKSVKATESKVQRRKDSRVQKCKSAKVQMRRSAYFSSSKYQG